jgi:phage repressor protein C with HTH and peptisase S24 domain
MTEEGRQLFEDLMRFKPDGLTANAWAVKAGVSRTIWADLRRHGNPSRRTLEKLLSAAASSLAEFEALRIGAEATTAEPSANVADARSAGWRGAPLPAVPLIGTQLAGEWGEAGSAIALIELMPDRVSGQVARPASMAVDRDAYALAMPGENMWPRFRSGRQLLVSPAAPVRVGDDVVVRLAGRSALIGELVRQSTTLVELRQFNPDLAFRVEPAHVAALHRVMGEAV